MCVIIYAEKGAPKEERIYRIANEKNSDGIGCAWVVKNKVQWAKGLGIDEFVKDFMPVLKPPFVVHFRVATCGDPIAELTHPFPVTSTVPTDLTGTANQVLFHNGTFKGYMRAALDLALGTTGLKLPRGEWSDSRVLAFLVAHKGPGILDLLDLDGSRVMLFGGNVFETWGTWHERKGEGWWYSNANFAAQIEPPKPTVSIIRHHKSSDRKTVEQRVWETHVGTGSRVPASRKDIWDIDGLMDIYRLNVEALEAEGVMVH